MDDPYIKKVVYALLVRLDWLKNNWCSNTVIGDQEFVSAEIIVPSFLH